MVPVLGSRRSLVAACCLYSLAPVLGWLVLGAASPDLLALTYGLLRYQGVQYSTVHLTYGLLSAVTVNFILLLTFTIPATWFPPEHRGKVHRHTSFHLAVNLPRRNGRRHLNMGDETRCDILLL